MSSDKHHETGPDSPLTFDLPDPADLPAGGDRRTFLMQTALVGSAAVLSGCGTPVPAPKVEMPAPAPPKPAAGLSADLDVVKKEKGPVMTVIDEFYKVGPGPSSSHTIGPMRITYDFYQRWAMDNIVRIVPLVIMTHYM